MYAHNIMGVLPAMYMYTILTMYYNVCTDHQSAGILHAVYYISCKADGHKAGACQHKAHRNCKVIGGDGHVPETSLRVSEKDISAGSCV